MPLALRSTFPSVRIDSEDKLICPCGFKMKDFLVKKESSPYRGMKFYACAKYISDPTRCKTTVWFDEEDKVRNCIPPSMQSPRTPRRQVDIRIYGAYTPPNAMIVGSKRKVDSTSFDSGDGNLEGDTEPTSPSAVRSTKRARYSYADAGTQTGDESRDNPASTSASVAASAPSTRPAPKALPRRRLFEEYLPPSKRKTVAPFDPFAPPSRDKDSDDLCSSTPPTSKPTTPAKNNRASFSDTVASDHVRQPPPPTSTPNQNPSTPPSLKNRETGLPTPPPKAWPRNPQLRCPIELSRPRTPAKSAYTLQAPSGLAPGNGDSDEESFGWNEDLENSFLDVVEGVDGVEAARSRKRFSPLFI
ncbi:hypothetical protein BDV06DRAFT_87413 [Aspergillus oleicola]